MTGQWAVVMRVDDQNILVYGPIADEDTAAQFAQFLTAEVDPAVHYRMRSPEQELLGFWRSGESRSAVDARPDEWPPEPGQIWQDRDGVRWVATAPYNPTRTNLACLARPADDDAEEIWQCFGPMSLVDSVAVVDAVAASPGEDL